MSEIAQPAITVRVDPRNPGQFFACCGLLEMADRLWSGAEGWFENGSFSIRALAATTLAEATLRDLLSAIGRASLRQVDPEDDASSPIDFTFANEDQKSARTALDLRLDWWKDDRAGGKRIKVWAGSMRCVRIARAMQSTLVRPELQVETLLDYPTAVYDPQEPDKKVEPYYFDARRGSHAQGVDVGFSPDSLQMTSLAYPAVEFLCLVGLQRFRPMPTDTPRVLDYFTWVVPLATGVAASAACGLLPGMERRGFRFRVAFRTDQRKHKAFTPATQFEGE